MSTKGALPPVPRRPDLGYGFDPGGNPIRSPKQKFRESRWDDGLGFTPPPDPEVRAVRNAVEALLPRVLEEVRAAVTQAVKDALRAEREASEVEEEAQ